MSSSQPNGGTTVITLSRDDAQHASAGVRGLIHHDLEQLPQPWTDVDPFTVAKLEQHVADTQAIADRYAPIMRQLEQQDVVDYGAVYVLAHQEAAKRNPDDSWRASLEADADLLAARPTGDVTLWAPAEILERVAAYLEESVRGDYFSEDEWTRFDPRYMTAALIRQQLGSAV